MNERGLVEMLPHGQRVHMAIHVPGSTWQKCGETQEAFEIDYVGQVDRLIRRRATSAYSWIKAESPFQLRETVSHESLVVGQFF